MDLCLFFKDGAASLAHCSAAHCVLQCIVNVLMGLSLSPESTSKYFYACENTILYSIHPPLVLSVAILYCWVRFFKIYCHPSLSFQVLLCQHDLKCLPTAKIYCKQTLPELESHCASDGAGSAWMVSTHSTKPELLG